MNNNPNIWTRSAYTFSKSLLKIDDIVFFAIENNFLDAYLIDKNVMYGTMEFYNKCIENNIKPIIGIEIDYNDINKILIAKNYDGYKELLKISSKIMFDDLNELGDSKNLISIENLMDLEIISFKNKEDLETLNLISKLSSSNISSKNKHLSTEQNSFSKKISNDVNLKITKQKFSFPEFLFEDEKIQPDSFLLNLLQKKKILFFKKNLNINKTIYNERLEYEYKIISKMKFSSYFLIVWDIIFWSEKNGICVGPGRGSAPGSLISFLLNITKIDPIENNLFFERFLNTERINLPDIDIDFEDERRDEVINYIFSKYGVENVSYIITFFYFKSKISFKRYF